jgi:hypothetical protein
MAQSDRERPKEMGRTNVALARMEVPFAGRLQRWTNVKNG